MLIKKLRVVNYKSYSDSGPLSFGPGFNVIVGQNNSGKTALLEAFRFSANSNIPHRNIKYEEGAALPPQSIFNVDLTVTGAELTNAFVQRQGQLAIPVDPTLASGYDNALADIYIRNIFTSDAITMRLQCAGGSGFSSSVFPSHQLFDREEGWLAAASPLPDHQGVGLVGITGSGNSDGLPHLIDVALPQKVYVFRAERLNVGTYPAQEQRILEPSAQNLAGVLAHLSENPVRWRRFVDNVKSIFPSIKYISVATRGTSFVIQIWTVDPSTERADLAASLEESGTGVGQVLAILYVAMTQTKSVIVIDEPNSFLHPGASKKLMQILRQYENQYIISTHSPELIAAAEPSTLHLVQWADGASTVQQLTGEDVKDLRYVLADIGVAFSDIFGADRVIWVEGPTEEVCFPMIARHVRGRMPLGVSVVAVRAPGDLEARRGQARMTYEVYEKLSSGHALLPSALAFSFDRETRSEQEMADLQRQSGGRISFLPRRMYENFLLDAEAIAAVLSQVLEGIREPIAAEQIDEWLRDNGGQFTPKDVIVDSDDVWKVTCDGAKLLKAVFAELADTNFSKTTHSVALTRWMLEHKPEAIEELINYIDDLVAGSAQSVGIAVEEGRAV